ncbi:dendritic arbor reduction protein 1-like [Culex pipiens pallens]|uniref:dendritic arbor reduction protein 1-like n=1 Tax=Culex pipiens pallens TaxID=42434 RepID=UPI001953BCE4|nr:dendritic arbor reduction protein 1-like [Culex pipiens pallens]
MRAWVLLLVSIFCLAKFVKSYGVSEHRVDYFKTVDGHEYNYHYHDGLAPRFEKSKLLQPQQQLLLRTKRPQTYKQPYHNKYFANEPAFASNFQHRQQQIQQLQQQQQRHHAVVSDVPAPTYASLVSSSSFQQQNSIPTFESHEKIRHSYVDEEEDSEEGVNSSYEIKKKLPVTMAKLASKNAFVGTAGSLHGLQVANQHRLNAQAQHNNHYNSYDEQSSSSSGSSEETNQATPTVSSPVKNSSGGFLSNESAPEHLPGFHYISSGYTYFNSHPHKQKFAAIPVEPPTPAIRKPYVAPTLTTPAPSPSKYLFQNHRPAPAGTTSKPSVPRRPYIAPALTTTKRPYVAPSVDTAAVTSKPPSDAFLLLSPQQNGASRFRYTTAKTASTASKQQSELYEPEFDIDIRIDLSSDSQ